MIEPSEPRYASSDGVHIAYQVAGDGPVDLIYATGIWSNLDVMWDHPAWAHFLSRLAAFSRLILFDMRGVGLSDRGPEPPYLELQRDDIGAVMDAVGIEHGIVMAGARASATAMLFAATYPERTDALILYAPVARTLKDQDFPYGLRTPDEQQAFFDRFVREVGTGRNLSIQAPSVAEDPAFQKWWARFERLVASPQGYEELGRIFSSVDVRDVLPAIHVPTLVVQREHDEIMGSALVARHVADSIEGARYVELAGGDHLPFIGDGDAIVDEVQEFVTGARPAPMADRVLATVLFTDIVESTRKQAELGDSAWKEIVLGHHRTVRESLTRYRGMENDTAGDGFYATFDGPARAIRCAQEIVERVRPLGVEIRAGVHTGECELIDNKVGGIAVSIGSRVASQAGPSEVLVSQTVKDLVAGSGLTFEDAGEHELKGVPDRWRLYRVEG